MTGDYVVYHGNGEELHRATFADALEAYWGTPGAYSLRNEERPCEDGPFDGLTPSELEQIP